jgi:hypothetical protein
MGFRFVRLIGLLSLPALLLCGQARASEIWGNNASFGNVTIESFDSTTGAVLQQFLAPNLTARNDNGRGIAVVGTTLYYTTADSGNIYVTNTITHTDLGVLVNTGLNGISNISEDGGKLYVTEYQNNTNIIHLYSLTGTPLGTIALGGPFGSTDGRDGFEVANNTLIANRGDAEGPYDKYDLSGNLLQAAFINPAANGINNPTGIAFDGTNYFVSDIFNNRLGKYDASGNFVGFVNLGLPQPQNGNGRLLEDLAVLGNTPGNGGGGVPEPNTLALLGVGVLGLLGYRRRRQKHAA